MNCKVVKVTTLRNPACFCVFQPAGGQAGQQGCVLLGPGTHGAVLHPVCSRAAAKRRRLAACGPGCQVLHTAGELSRTMHAIFLAHYHVSGSSQHDLLPSPAPAR